MKKLILAFSAMIVALSSLACTSAIVSGRHTASGRPMLWKHRDTGTEHNFVARVAPADGRHGYVALFNGGDSLLTEAWMGMNDAGFAIMNTASYNLMPDTAKFKDQEGVVMRRALEECKSLADFENLLRRLPKPLGVQANFGVLDADGNAAYYETGDYEFLKFALEDEPEGVIYRANYSYSGTKDGGYGYIREASARHQLTPFVESHTVTPAVFTEQLSRSFYHGLIGRDFLDSSDRWAIDQDFIPRKSSSASVVIEGMLPGETPDAMTMWTVIGYPPVSHAMPVTIDKVPDALLPTAPGFRSPYCNETLERKHRVFGITRGSGSHYVDLDVIRECTGEQRRLSREAYESRRK